MEREFSIYRKGEENFNNFCDRLVFLKDPCQITPSQDRTNLFYRLGYKNYSVDYPMYSQDMRTRRIFLLGNEHGDIIPFLEFCSQKRWLRKPCSIINFDFHYDDSDYDGDKDNMTASWQKYCVDIGVFLPRFSYNVVPREEIQSSEYTVQMGILEKQTLPQVDICSVDLDIFNHRKPADETWKASLRAIYRSAISSGITMVFLSPTFVRHDCGLEIARNIFNRIIKNPTNPL